MLTIALITVTAVVALAIGFVVGVLYATVSRWARIEQQQMEHEKWQQS